MSSTPTRMNPAASPMGFISDIHGNLPALEATLDEFERRNVHRIFAAGDLLLGGDQPVEVYKRLQQNNVTCTRGLSDMALATLDPQSVQPSSPEEQSKAERFFKTREAIGELVLRYLQQLPETLRIPLVDGSEILMVHGSPADPRTEMTHDMSDDELVHYLDDDPADIVITGASHVPFNREVGEMRLVNVGTVGAAPEGNIAHYTVITPRMDGIVIEQNWVEYGQAETE